MKRKPECFLSNPGYQAQAENECFTCSFQSKCFKKLPKNKKIKVTLESVDDHLKKELKDPKFKKIYDAHQFDLERMMDDIHLQNEIESILDDFIYKIKTLYSIDYLDIRREIARELLAKIGGHYETKKKK